ncbi:MAG: RNA-guided endonuclease TnpB family protein [Promethearchaeota archaeon]
MKTWIKYRDDRTFDEQIKHATVSKTKSGKFFISLVIEREIKIDPLHEIQDSKIEAFDMSLPYFLISDQIRMINPKFYHKEEMKLKQLHRRLSLKKKGSSNYFKAKLKLVRKYEQIYNRKLDWVHKISTKLGNYYEVIILEDLNIRGMQQFSSGISKAVALDFSWNQFVSILRYKLNTQGKHLVIVDRWFPSSKLCSNCGSKNENLTLSERSWTCKNCGMYHDRDKNVARNLKREGKKKLEENNVHIISTVGTTGSQAWGDNVRLSFRKQTSMNQESTP